MPCTTRRGYGVTLAGALLLPAALGALLLSRYSTSPDRAVRLAGELQEVSGLAWTRDGRLLAHNDERAILYELDPVTGAIRRQFPLGTPPPTGDFEALTVTDAGLALAASDGTVLDLALASDGVPSVRSTIRTGLGSRCDVEGMAALADTLFLACKAPAGRHLLIHRRSRKNGVELAPPIKIPLASVTHPFKTLNPSELVRDAQSGHFLMLAARQRMILELDAAGRVLQSRRLADGHRQAEGLALAPDGVLYIADEGARAPGTLSLYRPRPVP